MDAKMAKLVGVCRTDDYQFERRQLPLVLDDCLTAIIQFDERCVDCNHVCGVKQKDLEKFVQKFTELTNDEVAVALMVTSEEIMSLLAQMVPCVGCRRSVERLYNQLVETNYPALEPLIVTPNDVLSIKREYLFDPKVLYALFNIHGAKLVSMVESIPKSKKNKRCNLHSLETHKLKSTGNWNEIWDLLSQDCREEVVLIDSENLLDTLDTYLRKHRFCSECKCKVLRAYNILVGDLDSTKEKGYSPTLYDGLRCCPQERHIHMRCDTNYISELIRRAEPELAGTMRRDRHAKTLDIAQEEVLTCLGIHIYERLTRIGQKIRAEEQTWQILFYLGVNALKKSFEVALERKRGITNLELMYEELLEEERLQEKKKELKRLKRKKKKARQAAEKEKENTALEDHSCKCDSTSKLKEGCDSHICLNHDSSQHILSMTSSCEGCDSNSLSDKLSGSRGSDYGYSSGCDNCSVPGSHDGSDIAFMDGHCGLECSEGLCRCSATERECSCFPDTCEKCLSSNNSSPQRTFSKKPIPGDKCSSCSPDKDTGVCDCQRSDQGQFKMTLSLEEMLEAPCPCDEATDAISEEDIRKFKANQKQTANKRKELRALLKQRFINMQQQGFTG